MKTNTQPLVELRGVSIETPQRRPIVRELNVSLGHDQVALVGRNGVGKSTLLRVLAGLEEGASAEFE